MIYDSQLTTSSPHIHIPNIYIFGNIFHIPLPISLPFPFFQKTKKERFYSTSSPNAMNVMNINYFWDTKHEKYTIKTKTSSIFISIHVFPHKIKALIQLVQKYSEFSKKSIENTA